MSKREAKSDQKVTKIAICRHCVLYGNYNTKPLFGGSQGGPKVNKKVMYFWDASREGFRGALVAPKWSKGWKWEAKGVSKMT